VADRFIRVRLVRIDDHDLNLFEFDYDLTLAVFFMNGDNKVYARYGGRDPESADSRQSVAGLKYTMQSVLEMHEREVKQFAPRVELQSKYARDVTGWYGGGCMHCHQVKEAINERLERDGKWKREFAWRYPMPENVGVRLEVDRGNVVETVAPNTVADTVGIKPGDVLESIGRVPIHSFADAQFALDKAPAKGGIDIAWRHGGERLSGTLELNTDWKKSDITWRASVRGRLVPSLPMSGDDLKPEERESLHLSDTQTAFRAARLKDRAKAAGFQAGDVIVAVNDKDINMTVAQFRQYVRREFLVGDTIRFTVIRDGETMMIPLTLNPP
jgi:hypothetical protein